MRKSPLEAIAQVASIPKQHRTHGALILANIFFGTGAVLGALGLPATHPLVFALLREIGAGLILLTISICFYRQPSGTTGSLRADIVAGSPLAIFPYALRAWTVHWKRFALLGLAVFGNQAGFIVGVKMAGPITASVWQPSQPVFTAAICMTLGWEPIQRKRVVGVLLACMGCMAMVLLKTSLSSQITAFVDNDPVTTISKVSDAAHDDHNKIVLSPKTSTAARYVIGNFLFFVNCLCTSLYVVLSKRMLGLYPALLVTAWSYNGASLIMFVTTVLASAIPGANDFFCPDCPEIRGSIKRLLYIPSGAVPALLYYIIFASVASYGLITWANQHASGTLVMSYTVLQPVTSAVLTTLLLTLGATIRCQHQSQENLSDFRSEVQQNAVCLDYPSWGTFCGMAGVFAGLALIISTESPTSDKGKSRDEDVSEKSPLMALSQASMLV